MRMKNLFLVLLFTAAVAAGAKAQNDSACTAIHKIMGLLKEKESRGQVKGDPVSVSSGSMGKVTVFKSKILVPGMTEEVVLEGGLERYFRAYIHAKTYEEAVKVIGSFHTRMHQCFDSGWTFTEVNDGRHLYTSYKITSDKSVLSAGTVKYYLERNGNAFRLVLEIVY